MRAVKFSIGVGLLAGAVWVVAQQGDAVAGAWDHARRASPWLIVAALALPLVNTLVISVSFWLLNARFARVGLGETGALIAGAWLLNYLPLRPGLIGRIAYHRKHHGISVKESTLVLMLSMTLSAVAIAVLLVLALVRNFGGVGGAWWIWLCVPIVLSGGVSAWLGVRGRIVWRIAAALGVRYVDLLVWVARYAVVFSLVGKPLSLEQAIGMALVSQVALTIPLAGNGLGLREWAIGLAAGAMASGATLTSGPDPTGLAADLVNRGFEFAVALPTGLIAIAWLARRHRRGEAAASDSDGSHA